jgi:hypothetical protein
MYICRGCKKTFDEYEVVSDVWSDPGDYPSGAGGSALPDFYFTYNACPYCGADEADTFIAEEE